MLLFVLFSQILLRKMPFFGFLPLFSPHFFQRPLLAFCVFTLCKRQRKWRLMNDSFCSLFLLFLCFFFLRSWPTRRMRTSPDKWRTEPPEARGQVSLIHFPFSFMYFSFISQFWQMAKKFYLAKEWVELRFVSRSHSTPCCVSLSVHLSVRPSLRPSISPCVHPFITSF